VAIILSSLISLAVMGEWRSTGCNATRLERMVGGVDGSSPSEGGAKAESGAGHAEVVAHRAVDRLVAESRCATDDAHPQGSDFSYAQALSYVVRGSRIEITFICPPNADCIAGPHLVGEQIDSGLALGPPASSRPASTYKRIY